MGKIVYNGNTISAFNYTHEDRLTTKTITTNDTYNAVDDNADGYSSVTVNVQPTLITKSITENGTYDATDDNADGYSSVTVNTPSIPSGTHTDPWNVNSYTQYNITNSISYYTIVNGELAENIFVNVGGGSGYEGACFAFPTDVSLTMGVNYELSFDLTLPSSISFETGSYPFGAKHSSTQIISSSSAFNLTPDVNFAQTAGSTQQVVLPFTATASNYFVLAVGDIRGSSYLTISNLVITEVT